MIIMYIICASSCFILLIVQSTFDKDEILVMMPACLLVATVGLITVFLACYTATFKLFPLQERATALKWCNLVSRFLTILAPMVAEIPDPGPTYVILGFLIFSLIITFGLKENIDFKKIDEEFKARSKVKNEDFTSAKVPSLN